MVPSSAAFLSGAKTSCRADPYHSGSACQGRNTIGGGSLGRDTILVVRSLDPDRLPNPQPVAFA